MDQEIAAPRLSRRYLAAVAGSTALALAGWERVSARQQAGDAAGQVAADPMPGITVTGSGRASAPADRGILQLLVRYGPASPAIKSSSESASGYYGGSDIPAPDDDALSNVVNSLVDNGIDRERILTVIGSSTMYGLFGPGVSVIAAELDAELAAGLEDIVETAVEAAKATDLSFDQAGVVFSAESCQDVSDAAYLDAIEDGRAQADAIALALGVQVGELIGVTANAPWSSYTRYDGGGVGNGCGAPFELEDGLTSYFPSFNPGAEPEFSLTVSLVLTFVIAEEE
ncbi:MAG: SIMPL domain-containing protein [Thermomicrobiales bacterium]|nr:SIMPL domain-containing protein [Thermomicrobiales bacterium]